jgi:8-oxo-dGTP pyrophosphatase MutT (NUDIX family)
VSLHADAVRTLVDWEPPTPEQAAHRDRLLGHLAAHPDGLTRACFPDHLTAGVLVLSEDRSRVLLNLHRKAGRWLAFGGHCEPGDTTLAGAALREGVEESGIDGLRIDRTPVDIDAHTVGFCDPRGMVDHLDVRYAAVAPAAAEHAVNDESLDVRWWPLDALPDLGEEMLRLIRAARSRVGPPGHRPTTPADSPEPARPGDSG